MPILKIVAVSKTVIQCCRSNCVTKPKFNIHQIDIHRFVSKSVDQQKPKIALKKEKVRMYIAQRYIDYVKNYTKVLETRFPAAMRMYKVFSIGIKDFLRDLKTYISLRLRVTKDRGFANMSHKDIELYQKMPSDMLRIAPVLVLSAIPFGNYLIFPLAFLKPKVMLSSHFWSIQQKAEFSLQDLTERLKNNRPVLRALQAKLDSMPEEQPKAKWAKVLAMLGSGIHPSPGDVLECKQLFAKEPYQLSSLTYAHLGHLLKMHGFRKGVFRRSKLKRRAFLLLEMDKAILREGGVDTLNQVSLKNACLIRGLNSTHLNNRELRDWLQQWLLVSQQLDKQTYSLILHCPVLFAYNHPQNWVLIY